MTAVKFVSAKVQLLDQWLWVDGNSKITGPNGTFAAPKPNAFSLVQIEDCPWRTPTCAAACYVNRLEVDAPDTHALYRHNSTMIREILAGDSSSLWAMLLGRWITANCAHDAPGGFRWHVSGDVFSMQYASWISAVCFFSVKVQHWIYTRSFRYLHALQGANLTVNLSADRDNYPAALAAHQEFGHRICYLSSSGEVPDSLPEGSVIFPDYGLRGRDLKRPTNAPWWKHLSPERRRMVCPVDFFGASESLRCGPCKKCLR